MTSVPSASNEPTLLRRVLLVDAIATGAMGVLLLLGATPLESLLGLPASLLRGVGLLLVPFAVGLVWLAPRAGALPGLVRAVVVANVLWVVASILLLVSGLVNPTRLGTLFVAVQALAVVVFAYLEHRAAGRDGGLPGAARTAMSGR